MAATFGAPLAAVVLAVELLIFEFSTRALSRCDQREHRGGHALALFGTGRCSRCPPTTSPGSRSSRASRCSARRAACSRSSSTRGCSRSRTASAACRSVSSGGRPSARSGSRASGCSCRERSASATTRSATCSTAALRSARLPCSCCQARRVVGRARLGHVGRDARADPAHQRVLRRARRSSRAVGSGRRTSSPARSRSSRWPRPSAPRPRATVHRDRVPLRARPRLQRDPAA